MAKVLGVKQLLDKKYRVVGDLSPEMHAALGDIEDSFVCIIYGNSANGKTNFTIQLCKELCHLGVVLYNSHEEGHGKTIQDLAIRHNLDEFNGKFRFLENESFDDLFARLKKKHSPKIVVTDSIQYAGWSFDQYKKMKETFKRKIFLFISHADGKEPKGTVAKGIKYDANIKIWVTGYMAIIRSRYGGTMNYVIWPDAAKKFHGRAFKKLLNRQ